MKKFIQFAALSASSVLLMTGCITVNQQRTAQPEPQVTTITATASPEPSSPTASSSSEQTREVDGGAEAEASSLAPSGVAPGTSCGTSNTGASTLVVAENAAGLNCDQVQSIFADFNATFTSGDTSNYQIQGFTCHTRNESDIWREGRSVTCMNNGTRLEAMTVYNAGGIPVVSNSVYTDPPGHPGTDIAFSTGFAHCRIWTGSSGTSTGCSTTAADSVSIHFYDKPNPRHNFSGEPSVSHGQPSNDDAPMLPVGQSISISSSSCLNDGTFIICQGQNYGFKLSTDSYSTTP